VCRRVLSIENHQETIPVKATPKKGNSGKQWPPKIQGFFSEPSAKDTLKSTETQTITLCFPPFAPQTYFPTPPPSKQGESPKGPSRKEGISINNNKHNAFKPTHKQ
jgi:hypothetical protein